jgi:hypothetical protein
MFHAVVENPPLVFVIKPTGREGKNIENPAVSSRCIYIFLRHICKIFCTLLRTGS